MKIQKNTMYYLIQLLSVAGCCPEPDVRCYVNICQSFSDNGVTLCPRNSVLCVHVFINLTREKIHKRGFMYVKLINLAFVQIKYLIIDCSSTRPTQADNRRCSFDRVNDFVPFVKSVTHST